MLLKEVIRLVSLSLKDANKLAPAEFEDCIFLASRELQTRSLCSKAEFNWGVPNTFNGFDAFSQSGNELTLFVSSYPHNFLPGDKVLIDIGDSDDYFQVSSFDGDTAYVKSVTYNRIILTVELSQTVEQHKIYTDDPFSLSLIDAVYFRPVKPFYTGYASVFEIPARYNDSFIITPLLIDNLFSIGADGSKSPFVLLDQNAVESLKTTYDTTINLIPSQTVLHGSIEQNASGLWLRTPFDQKGYTLNGVIHFSSPYMADQILFEDNGKIGDAILSTIPEKYDEALKTGIKMYVYRALEERSMKGLYAAQMEFHERKWNQEIDRIKADANKYHSARTSNTIAMESLI